MRKRWVSNLVYLAVVVLVIMVSTIIVTNKLNKDHPIGVSNPIRLLEEVPSHYGAYLGEELVLCSFTDEALEVTVYDQIGVLQKEFSIPFTVIAKDIMVRPKGSFYEVLYLDGNFLKSILIDLQEEKWIETTIIEDEVINFWANEWFLIYHGEEAFTVVTDDKMSTVSLDKEQRIQVSLSDERAAVVYFRTDEQYFNMITYDELAGTSVKEEVIIPYYLQAEEILPLLNGPPMILLLEDQSDLVSTSFFRFTKDAFGEWYHEGTFFYPKPFIPDRLTYVQDSFVRLYGFEDGQPIQITFEGDNSFSKSNYLLAAELSGKGRFYGEEVLLEEDQVYLLSTRAETIAASEEVSLGSLLTGGRKHLGRLLDKGPSILAIGLISLVMGSLVVSISILQNRRWVEEHSYAFYNGFTIGLGLLAFLIGILLNNQLGMTLSWWAYLLLVTIATGLSVGVNFLFHQDEGDLSRLYQHYIRLQVLVLLILGNLWAALQ